MANLTAKQGENGKYGFVDDAVRLTKGFRGNSHGICNLNEDTIRSAFKSVGGISLDVMDEFWRYMK